MTLTLSDLLTSGGVAVVVVLLVQLVKRFIPEGYVQHVAVGLGIAIAVIARLVLGPITAELVGNAVLIGFFGGLSAVGLYQVQQPLGLLAAKAPDATPHG